MKDPAFWVALYSPVHQDDDPGVGVYRAPDWVRSLLPYLPRWVRPRPPDKTLALKFSLADFRAEVANVEEPAPRPVVSAADSSPGAAESVSSSGVGGRPRTTRRLLGYLQDSVCVCVCVCEERLP